MTETHSTPQASRQSKTIAILLIIVALYSLVITYLWENNKDKADYYVCNYNIGLALQTTDQPSHWICTNATGYYQRIAACYYQGSGTKT